MSSIGNFLKARLSRISSSGKFIPEIDGLRFIAVTLVLALHVFNYVHEKRFEALGYRPAPQLYEYFRNGALGVQLFFAISGFILALPFAAAWRTRNSRPKLSAYYWRRVTRIEPPYIISMLVYFLLLFTVGHRPLTQLLPSLAASLLYSHNLWFGRGSDINNVAWSLEIEVQFYLIAPLLCCVFALRNALARRAMLLAGIAIFALIPEDQLLRYTLIGQAHHFLAGLLMADIYLWTWEESPTQYFAYDFLAVVSAAIFVFRHKLQSIQFDSTPIAIVLLFYAAFCGKVTNWLLRKPAIVIIGGMCYTIYLYHELIIYGAGKLSLRLYMSERTFATNLIVQFIILSAVVIVTSAALFVVLERPFMKRDWPAKLAQYFKRSK